MMGECWRSNTTTFVRLDKAISVTATDEPRNGRRGVWVMTLTGRLRGAHSRLRSRSGRVALHSRRGASPSLMPPFCRRRWEYVVDCARSVVYLLPKGGRGLDWFQANLTYNLDD